MTKQRPTNLNYVTSNGTSKKPKKLHEQTAKLKLEVDTRQPSTLNVIEVRVISKRHLNYIGTSYT